MLSRTHSSYISHHDIIQFLIQTYFGKVNYEISVKRKENFCWKLSHINLSSEIFEYFPFRRLMSDRGAASRVKNHRHVTPHEWTTNNILETTLNMSEKRNCYFGIDECKRNCCGEGFRFYFLCPSNRFPTLNTHTQLAQRWLRNYHPIIKAN